MIEIDWFVVLAVFLVSWPFVIIAACFAYIAYLNKAAREIFIYMLFVAIVAASVTTGVFMLDSVATKR